MKTQLFWFIGKVFLVPIAALSSFVFSDSTLTFFKNDPFWDFFSDFDDAGKKT